MKRRRIREVKRGVLVRKPYILYVCFVGFLVLIVGMAWFLVGQECETIYNQSLGILIFQVGIIIKSNNGHAR